MSATERNAFAEVLESASIVDLTLTLDPAYPVHLIGLPAFHRTVWNWFESVEDAPQPLLSRSYVQEQQDGSVISGTYYSNWMSMHEHTGTHFDAPTHLIPPPDSGLEHANEFGSMYGDKVPLSSLQGPAVVVDVRSLHASAELGVSPWITPEFFHEWENEHGAVQGDEIVIFFTGWDEYFVPYPEGERYLAKPFREKSAPGWPAPHADLVTELADRGVKLLAIDTPSMGGAQDITSPHEAGLSRGMLFVECLCNLDQLPVRGSYFLFNPLKVSRSSGCTGRAFAYVPTSE